MITPPRPRRRSRWRFVWYPILGIASVDIAYQLLISWKQADLISHARPELLLLAVVNQLAVYLVLVPAMQWFYRAAAIRLEGWRVFSLVSAGLALSKIVPVGEYLLWRTALRRQRGGVGATTQWQVMYYAWMFSTLVAVFFVAEALTLVLYPNVHAPSLLGDLRFLPMIASVAFILLLFAASLARFRRLRERLLIFAYNKLGSRTLSPLSIIRSRGLNRQYLSTITFGMVAMWLIEAFTMFLCLRAVGLEVPLILAVFGFTFARLFTLLPIVPGGIGEVEAGTALFFAAYQYPLVLVFTATVLYRLITYWPPLFVGTATWLVMRKGPLSSIKVGYPVFASQMHRRGGVRP